MKALVCGVTGQDGYFLSKFLLEKGYEVHGMTRRVSFDNTQRIKNLPIRLHYGDMCDYGSLYSLMDRIKPDEVYNLAAQSHVGTSFIMPEYTADVVGLGVQRLLDVIFKNHPKTKFYQASSSEMYGNATEIPQDENTRFDPVSPYGVAKLQGYYLTKIYRNMGLHASNGILFNHESHLRGDKFVTKKIVKALVRIWKREQGYLEVGNIYSERDWGYAGDFVEAMWLMLQQDKGDDYVIATGRSHSVKDFINETAGQLGIDLTWIQNTDPLKEIGMWEDKPIIRISPKYYRPIDVISLKGNSLKAQKKLGWKPKTSFSQLISLMIEGELNGLLET